MATVSDHELTEVQVKEFRRTFALFDKKGRGTITVEELGDVMRSLGKHPSERELQSMVRDIGLNGSREIHFRQFLKMMAGKVKESETEEQAIVTQIREAFRKIDKDQDGYISAQELYRVIRGMGEQLSRDEVNEMVREADIDGDGKVSFRDFLGLMTST